MLPSKKALPAAKASSAAKAPAPAAKPLFQLVSDLHFERWNYGKELGASTEWLNTITPSAKYLIIAGDIMDNMVSWKNFLKAVVVKDPGWEKVFLVLGNTEWKNGSSIPDTTLDLSTWLVRVPKHPDVKHPQEDKIVILGPDFTRAWQPEDKSFLVVGCTLWGNVHARQFMQDRIPGRTEESNNALHRAELRYLRERIRAHREGGNREAPVLVITHYAPAIQGTSAPVLDGKGALWSNYQNDILGGEGMEHMRRGDVWVFGHTHHNTIFERDEVLIIANQRGNPSGHTGRPFNINFTFGFPPKTR